MAREKGIASRALQKGVEQVVPDAGDKKDKLEEKAEKKPVKRRILITQPVPWQR